MLCHRVQICLDSQARGLCRLGSKLARHVDRLADGDADGRVGQVDGHAAPGVEHLEARACDRDGDDWPARKPREHHDALASPARRTRRHIGGHRERAALSECLESAPHCGRPASVALAIAGPGAPDEAHVEMDQGLAQQLGVAMPRHHHVDRDGRRAQGGNQQELAVPESIDERPLPLEPLEPIGRLGNDPAGPAHESDVVRQQRSGSGRNGPPRLSRC